MKLLVIVISTFWNWSSKTNASSKTELQHQVEAVENHMPQVIIIDEIGMDLSFSSTNYC
jgi:ATP:corrinoid adenosyltransferase